MTVVISSSLTTRTDQISAEQIIKQFVEATNERDIHGLFYLVHQKFQGIFLPNDSLVNTVVGKGEYMKMLWENKLGREKQKVEILNLEIVQHIVSANVRLSNGVDSFNCIYNLYRDGSGWQVLHVLPYQKQKL